MSDSASIASELSSDGDSSWKAFGTATSRVLTLVLGALTSVVISRALGPADRGAYYVIVTVATTAMLLGHISIEQAQVYLWSRSEARDALRSNSVVLALLNGVVAGGAAWVLVVVILPNAVPVTSVRLLTIAVVGVPFGLMTIYTGGLLVLDGKIARFNVGRIVGNTAQCVGLLALVALHKIGVSSVVVMWVAATTIPLCVFLPTLSPSSRHVSWSLLRTSLAIGARYHTGMAALFLLWRVDVFLLNAQVSRASVGLYSVAVTLAEATYLVTDSIGQAVLPRQVELSVAESAAFTARVARTTFLVSALLIAAVSVAVPLLLPLIFGEAYSGAVAPLLLLGPGIVALACSRTITPYLVRLNRPWLVSGITALALLSNVLLNLVLIPPLGISGAAIASTISYSMLAAATIAWLIWSGDVKFVDVRPRIEDVRGPVGVVYRRMLRRDASISSPT